ncbi:MAG: hypothetical protein ACI4VF_09035 [Lachnospirales bacterium]
MKDKYKDIDEIRLLKRSKLYIDAMSQGINPLTGEYVEDTILQENKLQVCLEYVSYVLEQVIENGGIKNNSKKESKEFILNEEDIKRINYSDEFIGINTVAEKINEIIDLEKSKKISGTYLSNMLVELGYLYQPEGIKGRRLNKNAPEIGAKEIDRDRPNGTKYIQVVYSKNAQKFIVQKLYEFNNNIKNKL